MLDTSRRSPTRPTGPVPAMPFSWLPVGYGSIVGKQRPLAARRRGRMKTEDEHEQAGESARESADMVHGGLPLPGSDCPEPSRTTALFASRTSQENLNGYVSSAPSQRRALRPGMKQYSPPRVTTKRGNAASTLRIGRRGIGNVPLPSAAPADRVLLPSHRRRRRCRSSIPTGRTRTGGRGSRRRTRTSARDPRRRPRARPPARAARTRSRAGSSDECACTPATAASRGFTRRMCEPSGVLYPSGSSAANRNALFFAGSTPSAGSS